MLCDVGQHRDTVRQNLQEATADKELLFLSAIGLLDSQRTGFENGHQRRVSREHAKLTLGSVDDDELDLSFEEAPLNAHDSQGEFHSVFFICSACSRASSMVPTM